MKAKKKYKKQILNSLKDMAHAEYSMLETMTNLMLLKEMKERNISFKKGDTFSFEDNIFDYSEDKNIRRIAKLRKKMLKTMNKLVEKGNFKDKEIEFLA
ncbi:MAG: hypothetical protein KUL76_04295 [Kaistella sp.]|uniref:hypothetical protein n=1 Tax=Chryseobacterium sp. VAUSW3 TaxID=2010998 RepID=UPI000B4DC4D9|nr:hypothetical protein [Chryseobacterium sp. VAUSW3]MBV2165737.1 hypothetical protein [Kaistella sp.]OWR15042.1 hypothetical protein CDW55_01005 [Chryseobacterium sp. VAUSW3]